MSFAALEGYLADDALLFPPVPSVAHPEGRAYRVPSPDHKTGLRLAAFATLGMQLGFAPAPLTAEELEALPEEEREARERAQRNFAESVRKAAPKDDEGDFDWVAVTLGSAYSEMTGDGVSWVLLQRMARYALFYFALSPEAADDMARRSAEGNQPAPNREQRRAVSKSPRASTASATSTRRRGSTSGTSSTRKREP